MLTSVHGLPEYLGTTESWLLHGAILGWAVAALFALLGLFWPDRFGRAPTHVVGALAAIAMGVYFLLRFVDGGVEPLANAFEVLMLISLGLVLAYFIALPKLRRPSLAAWIFPGAVLITLTALPLAAHIGPAAVSSGAKVRFSDPILLAHVLLMVLSCALFTFASLVSVVYLLQDRALRTKRHNPVLQTLPSVETLRGMVVACMLVGFPTLTVSLICGFIAVWAELGEWLKKPLVIMSILMWLVFLVTAVGRFTGHFHGRRFISMVLLGFVLVLVTFFGTGFIPGKHSFMKQADPTPSSTPESDQSQP